MALAHAVGRPYSRVASRAGARAERGRAERETQGAGRQRGSRGLPMKVLHLTLSYSHGGRREAIGALALGLREFGVTSHLGCLDGFGSESAEHALFGGTITLDRQGLFDRAALRRLRGYCVEHAIDVVHAHDAASEAMAALAMPTAGPAMLMSFHRTRDLETARFRDRLRNALVGLRVGAVVTASRERLRHYIDNNYVRASKVSCIPLGIDLERFRPDAAVRAAARRRSGAAEDTLVVGTVGHFGPEKGVDLAIGAFQDFMRKQPSRDARLLVLGRGEPAQEARMRVLADAEFGDRIHFCGFQPDPERWFPGFDVLLHGARDEAFGLVLAEAQACGVPVVAARVGGIPEVVLDRQTGRLAPVPETDALSDALQQLAASSAYRGDLARQAIEHARQKFSRRRYAGDYLETYRRVLG
jgi:glycosyltransferase involved in cell wall biosynthesis